MLRQAFFALCLLVALNQGTTAQQTDSATTPRSIDFERDIKPLFAKHCISCHGKEKQESGFRLDRRQAALLGGDNGVAIHAGKSSESRLIQFVQGDDPDRIMPPDGPPLSQEEVALLRAWIDAGATWPTSDDQSTDEVNHWAYQPLTISSLPEVQNKTWPRNAIDYFILANLESNQVSPSREADRHTLIRRLSLDLTGLLPSVDDVQAFINDSRPNAYEVLVDRLLDSPHFGERWARHWLDMARYADSDGYEKDNPRPDAYRYRDWVIDTINDDMPFDQFTIEQLAGDLLPDATPLQRLATAFHRQTLTNTEGGTDQEQFRVEACFDRTETTGAIWLGLTVGCARCHSHKYDAISQREYYQMFAFFNNADEQTQLVPKSRDEVITYHEAKQKHEQELQSAISQLNQQQSLIAHAFDQWHATTREKLAAINANPIQHTIIDNPQLACINAENPAGVQFELQSDKSYLVTGTNPASADYQIVGKLEPGNVINTLRLDVLADAKLPAKGPGRVSHGNFVLSEVRCELSKNSNFDDAQVVEFSDARADHEQADKPWLAKNAIDGNEETGWAVGPQYGKNHWAEFQLKSPVKLEQPTYVRITLQHRYGKQHTIGRFRLTLQSAPTADPIVPESIAKILLQPQPQWSPKDQQSLIDYYSTIDPSTKPLVDRIDALKKSEPAKPEINARVLLQRTANPRTTYVLRRGEFLDPIQEVSVTPSGLATLPPLVSRQTGQAADRLDLAQWLVSKDNSLSARVAVNHVWRLLFGAGIVRTANDFGVRGDRPTHPQLLDWLAGTFAGANPLDSEVQPWSRKALIKHIVMSATYRQSSAQRTDLQELDPQNLWLARQNRLRVEGEIIRDISLDAAGLLSRKIGGPSVFPTLPPGIAELSYAGNFKWDASTGGDRYRRGMYTFFKRTSPHPNLITFDCPDANLTCIDRNRSNTPLQALVALNNDTFAEAARSLAQRVLRSDCSDDRERITFAVNVCLSRPPSDFELHELQSLLDHSRSWYASHEEEAKLLTAASTSDSPLGDVAAWIATCRVLINLDEFITRE